jgi:hypothetical protein
MPESPWQDAKRMDMAVVASPATAAEAQACFDALTEADFRPMVGYRGGSPTGGPKPTSYPVLVPKTEFEGAQRLVLAMKEGRPQKAAYETVDSATQLKRGLGALAIMAMAVVGLTVAVLALQYIGGLLHHVR